MPEDKLTPTQRLRLECLAQAAAIHASNLYAFQKTEDIVETARTYEAYLTEGETDSAK